MVEYRPPSPRKGGVGADGIGCTGSGAIVPVNRVVLRRDAHLLARHHRVRRIDHAERAEDVLLVPAFERRARHLLDDETEHACAGAVVPLLAGLVEQRQLPLALLCLVDQRELDRVGERVADAGGMRQQLTDRHRLPRRPRRVGGVLLVERGDDLKVVVAVEVFRDRVVELQLAGFHQHHDGDRRHRLRHRRDREDRIRGHRRALGDVELTGGPFEQHALAVDDQGGDAGRVAAAHGVVQLLRERGLARGRQLTGLGGRARTLCRDRRGTDERGDDIQRDGGLQFHAAECTPAEEPLSGCLPPPVPGPERRSGWRASRSSPRGRRIRTCARPSA